MAKVKVFVTDGQTDGLMRFNVPTLSRKRGTITDSGHIHIVCFFIIRSVLQTSLVAFQPVATRQSTNATTIST